MIYLVVVDENHLHRNIYKKAAVFLNQKYKRLRQLVG